MDQEGISPEGMSCAVVALEEDWKDAAISNMQPTAAELITITVIIIVYIV